MAILTVNEFTTLKNISKKINTERIEQAISYAENVDLRDYLGNFYFDVVSNKAVLAWQELMDGSIFSVDSESYIHEGLKQLIADLAYARYVATSNTEDTAFGLVSKDNDNSTPLERNQIKDIISQVQRDADAMFTLINLYLEQNTTLFSRYCKGDDPNINTFTQRFDVI